MNAPLECEADAAVHLLTRPRVRDGLLERSVGEPREAGERDDAPRLEPRRIKRQRPLDAAQRAGTVYQ